MFGFTLGTTAVIKLGINERNEIGSLIGSSEGFSNVSLNEISL